MNFTLTNTIKNKINGFQKVEQKKTLKIKDIVLLPEFEKMRISDSEIKADADKITSGTAEGETVTGEISGYAKNPITGTLIRRITSVPA